MNDSFDNMPCLYYHHTGVFFRYVLPKNTRAIRLTYIILPINSDDLFTVQEENYNGPLKRVCWSYHDIKAVDCIKEGMMNMWKLYYMNGSKRTLLGYFRFEEFMNKKHFNSFQISGEPFYYNRDKSNFHLKSAGEIFQFACDNVSIYLIYHID